MSREDDTTDELTATCDDWSSFIARFLAWKRETFPRGTPRNAAIHLQREAKEVCDAINEGQPVDKIAEEFGDCLVLALSGLDLLGVDPLAVVEAKLAKNKTRTWGKPDADGVIEHVREGAGEWLIPPDLVRGIATELYRECDDYARRFALVKRLAETHPGNPLAALVMYALCGDAEAFATAERAVKAPDAVVAGSATTDPPIKRESASDEARRHWPGIEVDREVEDLADPDDAKTVFFRFPGGRGLARWARYYVHPAFETKEDAAAWDGWRRAAETPPTDPLHSAVGAFLAAHGRNTTYSGATTTYRRKEIYVPIDEYGGIYTSDEGLAIAEMEAVGKLRAAFEAAVADRATVASEVRPTCEICTGQLVDWLFVRAGRKVPGIINDTIGHLARHGIKVKDIDPALACPADARFVEEQRQRLVEEVARTAVEVEICDRAYRAAEDGPMVAEEVACKRLRAANAAAKKAVTDLIAFDDDHKGSTP